MDCPPTGCPVCVEAEQRVAEAIDSQRYDGDIVHLGEAKSRIADAEAAGFKSVPALVLDGAPFHINFVASLDDLPQREAGNPAPHAPIHVPS